MRTLLRHVNNWFDPALLLATFLVLFIYTVGLFLALPYWGFEWGSPLYENVSWVTQSGPLYLGDTLYSIGPIRFDDLIAKVALSFPESLWAAQVLPLTIVRNGETLQIAYAVPGFTWAEFFHRVSSPWWLGWMFGSVGLLNFLSVRPKDDRWRLLTAFYCITAILLVTSTNVGRMRLWEASLPGRLALWFSIPVYWHLHWTFPDRLCRRPILKAISIASYPLAGGVLVIERLGWLPNWVGLFGFLAAILGIIFPQIVRLFLPSSLKRARLLWLILLASSLPAVGLVFFILAGLAASSITLNLLSLTLLPVVYFYVAYQRQLGGLELRANRLVAVYLFAFLLMAFTLPLAYFLLRETNTNEFTIIVIILSVIAIGLVAALAFPSFQKFVERRFLGLRPLPRHWLGYFNARIAASLDYATLTKILADEVLPDLLIRQSALVTVSAEGRVLSLYTRQVAEADLPTSTEVAALSAEAGRFRSELNSEKSPCPWARVVLCLKVSDKLLGLWLLGRRDPDDFYAQSEIEYLQTLAGQTALALKNLEQTEQLRALYQFNIDQREAERSRLARDLHDVTLNQLAVLRNSAPPTALSPYFLDAYERIVNSLREAINELRPPLLDYGLYFALKALASEHEEREGDYPELLFDLPNSPARYDSKVEEYSYRILKQAYDNALTHAGARQLRVSGRLEPDCIAVTFEDDGRGFLANEVLQAGTSLTHRQFGLRGMVERAAIIGATLRFDSAPDGGTHVHLSWQAPAPNPRSSPAV